MSDAHVLTLLGAQVPDPSRPDPEALLRSLTVGMEGVERFRLPTWPAADTWLRITSLPTTTEAQPGPFRNVFAAIAGGLAEVSVLVRHDEEDGLRLYVSAGHVALRIRLRNQLAPQCDLAPESPPMPRGHAAGVRYRLQAELARESTQQPLASGLLDRLSTIGGNWSVVVKFGSVHQVEIHEAHGVVDDIARVAAENLTVTQQQATSRSTTTVSAAWSRVQAWLDVHRALLSQGGAIGLWKTGVWAYGEDDWALRQVIAAMRGAAVSEQGRWYVAHDTTQESAGAPEPRSLLTTAECAAMLLAPTASIAGLAVRPAPPAARRSDASVHRIELGTFWSTELPAAIGLDDLEGHAFVTGTTGSGKTTTLHRLLAGAWNLHRVPFLVIDPVKDDYSQAADLFHGGLRVVTGNELSMNVMAAWPGENARQHVAQVAQAFRGAFTMPSPTPYVVTQLFDQVAMQPGGPKGTELFDVRDAVEPLVNSLGYSGEVQSNIRASLLTRLNVLLAPTRAHRFAWPDSAMIGALFDRPTVVTLADLVDDEERSFVVLLLALAAWARARGRKPTRPVEHLLVLEEAHRVIPEVDTTHVDPESGSARVASAAVLTAMLAEVRSYGEQVIVVDQSPAKVAADVVRNTNLKILHRTVSAADQAQVAAAVGIEADDASLLGSLARGQAIVSTRREVSPQTIAIQPPRPVDLGAKADRVPRLAPGWPCCTDQPELHFRAWRAGASAEAAMAMFVIGARVGSDEAAGAALRKLAVSLLRPLQRALGAPQDCLAWAGLRRILVAERATGQLQRATALTGQLSAFFRLWHEGAAVTKAHATEAGVAAIGSGFQCTGCGRECGIGVPAWIHLAGSPKTGIRALASTGWRLDDVASWTKAERTRLEVYFGVDGAVAVLRCQIHQAVRRARLPIEVAEQLLKRADFPMP
jgi:hypothetical protein